jgi:hypothetical protein
VDGGSQLGSGLTRLTATLSLIALSGLLLLSAPAGAATTGAIMGTVTSAAGGMIEATVCAIPGSGEASCAPARSDGEYTISGLASGEYKVSFSAICLGEQCGVVYAPLFYNDKLSLATAVPVQVSAPATTAGIDAGMETEGENKRRVYLEDESPAGPTGEATGTLPGAIEPLPVNRQIEEEFFAHPPWDKGAIPASLIPPGGVYTLAKGVAVAATAATVKDATAEIMLDCAGAVACDGSVKLVERVTKRHFTRRHGKRVSAKHVRKIVIGTADFSLSPGASETLDVHLTAIGQRMIGRAGKKALPVKLTGSGIEHRILILE